MVLHAPINVSNYFLLIGKIPLGACNDEQKTARMAIWGIREWTALLSTLLDAQHCFPLHTRSKMPAIKFAYGTGFCGRL